ncbi:MAG TPA: hypothetical protein DHU55_13640 [Blastocatellia bacterium]|nr:hypothetical protein [Blastocatellia bacterium]
MRRRLLPGTCLANLKRANLKRANLKRANLKRKNYYFLRTKKRESFVSWPWTSRRSLRGDGWKKRTCLAFRILTRTSLDSSASWATLENTKPLPSIEAPKVCMPSLIFNPIQRQVSID